MVKTEHYSPIGVLSELKDWIVLTSNFTPEFKNAALEANSLPGLIALLSTSDQPYDQEWSSLYLLIDIAERFDKVNLQSILNFCRDYTPPEGYAHLHPVQTRSFKKAEEFISQGENLKAIFELQDLLSWLTGTRWNYYDLRDENNNLIINPHFLPRFGNYIVELVQPSENLR